MGYYVEIKTKEIKLRRDTPETVIRFIYNCIYHPKVPKAPPDHPFFYTARWPSVFGQWAWYDNPYTWFECRKNIWTLYIHADVKGGVDECILFAEWINPYIMGHKPKEYIGWYKGEDQQEQTNLYITRPQTLITVK